MMFIGICVLYLFFVFGTVFGTYQVVSGLRDTIMLNIIFGFVNLWLAKYMIGELAPIVIEMYNKI